MKSNKRLPLQNCAPFIVWEQAQSWRILILYLLSLSMKIICWPTQVCCWQMNLRCGTPACSVPVGTAWTKPPVLWKRLTIRNTVGHWYLCCRTAPSSWKTIPRNVGKRQEMVGWRCPNTPNKQCMRSLSMRWFIVTIWKSAARYTLIFSMTEWKYIPRWNVWWLYRAGTWYGQCCIQTP